MARRCRGRAAQRRDEIPGGAISALREVGFVAGPISGSAGSRSEADSQRCSSMVVRLGHVAAAGTHPRGARLAFDEAGAIIEAGFETGRVG
jgi:hypothetical protein